MMKNCVLALAIIASLAAPCMAGDELVQGFLKPADAAKPWTYWWWLNGCVSKDGIVRDLDSMQRNGISGALVFHAGTGRTPKSTVFMSPPWREFFRFAVEEAAKRDITIGFNLCGGWNAGGPWVEPADAAKMLVHRTTNLKGPLVFDGTLPKLAGAKARHHDVAVLAWPVTEPDTRLLVKAKLTASSSFPKYGPELATDGDPATRWISNSNQPGDGPRPDRPEHLQWDYAKDFTAAAVHVVPYLHCGPRDCQLQASADGKTYRTISRFQVEREKPQTFTFEETSSQRFRLVVASSHPHRGEENWNVQISEVMLLQKGQNPPPIVAKLHSKDVLDLTDKMDPAGRLRWRVPDGHWRVVRFGWQICPRAHTQCTGGKSYLEIDPLSAKAMDKHFAATAGVVLGDVGPHAGKTFKYVHIDSGEIGEPDWTPSLRADFRRLRGYDPFPYLAAKAGHVVDDPEMTERFLEDYERTIGDLMIECYYGRLGKLARAHGLGTHSEAAGYQKPTVDALRSMGCNDICMSEFWSRRSQANPYIHQLAPAQLRYHDGIKNAASAAHVYGRRIVQAEAYTVTAFLNWSKDPFALKDIGDRAFCAGLNRNMLCFMVLQPEEDSKPGYAWPNVGANFDRHVTWWPMGKAWLTYLARCQYLLQAGRFVADVCYFQGEWAPAYVPARWAMDPPLPLGSDCDTINAEALIGRAAAGDDGRLVLSDGQSYRYLVLWQGGRWQRPSREIFVRRPGDSASTKCPEAGSKKPLALSPATLRKLEELVEAGVTVIGPRPVRSIGLTGYPNSDAEVKKLADALWGETSNAVGQRKVGRGRVIWGQGVAEVMRADSVLPDLEIRESPETKALPANTLSGIPHPGSFDWIHRKIDGADVYFVANLRNASAAGQFTFRTESRQPELWDPVTGEVRALPEYTVTDDGRTTAPIQFAPRQSTFVVFRRPASETPPAQAGKNFPELKRLTQIAGPWQVSFDTKWGGPESVVFEKLEDWSRRPESGIKHYSGTAMYQKTFDLPETSRGGNARIFLDLGRVQNLATVRLNGKDLGVVWTAPWRVEITGTVKPTGNKLEIDVVNLWPNRLIGDAALPPERRLTKTNVTTYKKGTPLLPSGLLGPVVLQAAE